MGYTEGKKKKKKLQYAKRENEISVHILNDSDQHSRFSFFTDNEQRDNSVDVIGSGP